MTNPNKSKWLLWSILALSALVLAASPQAVCAADSNPIEVTPQGMIVQSNSSATSIPPDVARYLKGPIPQGRQYEFLIGDWDVDATRFNADGSVLFRYKATWTAKYLNEGRMIMDDFKALTPDGRPISSFVTLRTYSEVAQRWEMAGLAAMQPAATLDWHGVWTGDEMQINAAGVDPTGKLVKTKIRFSEITRDRFMWESELSIDGGKTWARNAALAATRGMQNHLEK